MTKRLLLYILVSLLFVPRGFAQQLDDFLSAARAGNPVALYNAAVCYRHGLGVAPNRSRSNHFMRRAAELGLPEARERMAKEVASGTPSLAAYWSGAVSTENFVTYESYENGCYYGQQHGGMRDGYGTYLWDSGTAYVGQWEDGERYGMGFTTYDDQTHFGSYLNHAVGYGATIMADTLHHIASCPEGRCYVGEFADGLPHGTGTIYDASGEVVYYGPFVAGRPTHTYPSVERYSTYRWVRELLPTGDTYEGEMVMGQREGFGIYRWAAGAVWFGYWRGGVRSGEGLFIDSEGRMIAGLWVGDEFQE